MSIEYVTLDATPAAEPCAGNRAPEGVQKAECRRYKELLEKRFPDYANHGVSLVIKRNPHEDGDYFEVNAVYRDGNEEAEDYANFMQNNIPETWDDVTVKSRCPVGCDHKTNTKCTLSCYEPNEVREGFKIQL